MRDVGSLFGRELHLHFGVQTILIAIDARDGEGTTLLAEPNDNIACRWITIHRDIIPLLGVTNIVDRYVVVVTPEERDIIVRPADASMLRAAA